jgi:hypothetical protein
METSPGFSKGFVPAVNTLTGLREASLFLGGLESAIRHLPRKQHLLPFYLEKLEHSLGVATRAAEKDTARIRILERDLLQKDHQLKACRKSVEALRNIIIKYEGSAAEQKKSDTCNIITISNSNVTTCSTNVPGIKQVTSVAGKVVGMDVGNSDGSSVVACNTKSLKEVTEGVKKDVGDGDIDSHEFLAGEVSDMELSLLDIPSDTCSSDKGVKSEDDISTSGGRDSVPNVSSETLASDSTVIGHISGLTTSMGSKRLCRSGNESVKKMHLCDSKKVKEEDENDCEVKKDL